MRADIAVIKQGARNAADGISMLQTMEGAMAVIDEALVRMKELAEQASTGSYSDSQREIMDNEFQQMGTEIQRIAHDTKFNSIHLLDCVGSANDATIHFGVGSSIDVTSVNVTASTLGVASASLTSATNAQNALDSVTTAITRKDSARASFGYMMNRLESTNAVLNIQAENLMASESRISDVDVATEMASLTRNQVLSQAGVSMLGQANGMPQMALTLLR
jgi:flagellin